MQCLLSLCISLCIGTFSPMYISDCSAGISAKKKLHNTVFLVYVHVGYIITKHFEITLVFIFIEFKNCDI